MRRLVLLVLVCLAPAAPARAGDDPGFLEQYAATYRFRLGRPVSIRPGPEGEVILFLRSGPRSFEQVLYEYDVATGGERVLLTTKRLLAGARETLTADELARRERRRLVARGITSFQMSKDGRRVLVPLSGRLFVADRATELVREVTVEGRAAVPRLSPDGNRIAYVADDELHVVDVDGGTARRLTHDAGGTITNGLAEFVAQEEMGRHDGFWWSPDASQLAYQQTDTAGVELMTIADATHAQRPARQWPYPRPGKTNAQVRLGIVSVEGGPTRWVDWDRAQYPYLAAVTWQDNAPLTVLVQNRRQTEEMLLAVDAGTCATRLLLVEQDDAWVAIDRTMPQWLDDGSGFLWTTDRRGARQIERRDRDGSLVKTLSPSSLELRGFVHLDEPRGRVFVLASDDPTETHLYRLDLDGETKPARLTPAGGVHNAVYSENGDVHVLTRRSMTGESLAVRDAGDNALGELTSVVEAPSFGFDLSSTVEILPVGAVYAALIKPRRFDADRVYPMIVHVYGGPTGQMVRKGSTGYLLDQWIADRGYVVVRIDGRGTPGRGRAWQRAVKGNLIDLPLDDQAAAVQTLGETFDFLDPSRVGIYGWSFGGYFSAMAVMRRPDVFHAGVAGAPVVDWRDYDTHYTERYLGLPQENPSGYAASNVLTWAGDLSRPLLIIHGTADDNVYFMHSLKLADRLFRAGRDYELLPLPGFTHMVPDPVVVQSLYTRIMRFFDAHLEP